MPRHKRQRPSWLPAWVPYKDGRYVGLARQTLLAWLSTILALVFFLMTVSYATEKSKLSKSKYVRNSRSSTILILRVLSEIAGVFLAASIWSTFEVVQWVLISRPGGIMLPQFLALQSSTGPLGLLVLALGRGLPPNQWPFKPRILSLLRLIAELAVPVLGVLIMSRVDTKVVHVPLRETMQPFAFGMEPFNGSVASQLVAMGDLLFNTGYVTFLKNPLHAVYIAQKTRKPNKCYEGLSMIASESCTRKVLITQEYQNVEATLPITQHLESTVILSQHQQAYFFEYRDNIRISKGNLKCATLHSGPAYYQVCTGNAEDGDIHAALIPCPVELMIEKSCSQNTTWMDVPLFTTSLKVAFVNASVAYDRKAAQILSYEIETNPKYVTVNASELLTALTSILNSTTGPTTLTADNPILGTPSQFFGRLVAGHMYRITKMMDTNPLAHVKGVNAIQSLLALTLFYCQNGALGQTLIAFYPSATAKGGSQTGAFQKVERKSVIALAEIHYKIEVGRATLLAYTILGGLTLVICISALVFGSIFELIKFDAEPTLFPALDFFTQCKVEDRNGKVVPSDRRVELAWIKDGKKMFKEIEALRVTRRQRKARAVGLELPGVETGGQ